MSIRKRHQFEEEQKQAPYLTPREAMDFLRVGKNTLYKLLNSGELKGFRVGKQWRIERESLKPFS